jgi:hypothetical protein
LVHAREVYFGLDLSLLPGRGEQLDASRRELQSALANPQRLYGPLRLTKSDFKKQKARRARLDAPESGGLARAGADQ